MRGLLEYLSPFAPDQSGASAVFYGLGGMTIICDAGGCTGNICGFDEPRWFMEKDRLFSAGLRDMDAILGRDRLLVEKIGKASSHLGASFVALIGTPVPAVIGTDLHALARLTEKTCGIPAVYAECTGTELYDAGEEAAYEALFKAFSADEGVKPRRGVVGVLGATPLDHSYADGREIARQELAKEGYEEIRLYGGGATLEDYWRAGEAEKNFVASPAGLRAAKYLEKRFGTPYEIRFPFLSEAVKERLLGVEHLSEKHILIAAQQVEGIEIRKLLAANGVPEENMTVGTWFREIRSLKASQDLHFDQEEAWVRAAEDQGFDLIIGDASLERPLKSYCGDYLAIPHFAVFGGLRDAL